MKYVGYIALAVLTIALNSLAALQMWNWFLMPLGLPEVKFVYWLGIIAFVRLVIGVNTSINSGVDELKTDSDRAAEYVFAVLMPLCTLGFGYVIHLFV